MSNAPQHRLVYIRHGETAWSRSGRHTGITDVPLTPTGEEQARALAPVVAALRLRQPTVWVSPRERAARTAELAGLTVTGIEPELAEWDYGDYEGVTSVEIRRDVAGWTVWDAPIPGGESIDAVAARADDVLAKARDAMADGDVVLVAHGHIGRVLAARFLDADARFGRHLPVLPASASVFAFDHDGVPQLQQFGRTGYDAVGYEGR
ncbi:Phosphoglycerate mutase OS=Tsukamurella paurometabola (strain ATCC 8368 / DSM / CCUG 35730 /CIP 100753 / JCM 10117 / KCTC 9821 / NBRC 16120 / NCIMB 702349/ NCTC 13040) OX=521096 GN=Tpau_1113 PE=4 SV=1 [Tsukamurella paurometabola]|uniref:Phosphoglycerate mutase n=1 Tax=Tsukamurella paurometabola (strain ATCC 8368 / DSM 20162 / CCUG 35730 / CIP 100753 / JCM 10117 / KCTC 9821 / NBRC 16120 / NCIMB 702349 / NCTC 13040) TaxID=521096 RepID=D5UVF5_TSUPD|nr:histidine phosphatase family protein [Tsukamurella paurometabola]ADG77745.1 Phosphoglycerate mutase [Tsukamurella paurometabola DSM 20162]SUP28595.1 Alpha-ribazole phosphatase [Tsukamurella paurometabola]